MNRPLVLALMIAPLSGCISVLPKPPPAPDVFQFSPQTVPGDEIIQAPVGVTLGISAPNVPARLNSSRLIMADKEGRLSVIAGAEWADTTPKGLRLLGIQKLQQSEMFTAVVRADGPVRPNCFLDWDVFSLHAVERQGKMFGTVEANLRIIDPKTRSVLATASVSEETPVFDRNRRGAAAAINAAANLALAEVGRLAYAHCPKG